MQITEKTTHNILWQMMVVTSTYDQILSSFLFIEGVIFI